MKRYSPWRLGARTGDTGFCFNGYGSLSQLNESHDTPNVLSSDVAFMRPDTSGGFGVAACVKSPRALARRIFPETERERSLENATRWGGTAGRGGGALGEER